MKITKVDKVVEEDFSKMGDKALSEVEGKWDPPEGTFTKPANEVAQILKDNSSDLAQAMARLNFYINRAGSNLSEDDKARLEKVKEILPTLFCDKPSNFAGDSVELEVPEDRVKDVENLINPKAPDNPELETPEKTADEFQGEEDFSKDLGKSVKDMTHAELVYAYKSNADEYESRLPDDVRDKFEKFEKKNGGGSPGGAWVDKLSDDDLRYWVRKFNKLFGTHENQVPKVPKLNVYSEEEDFSKKIFKAKVGDRVLVKSKKMDGSDLDGVILEIKGDKATVKVNDPANGFQPDTDEYELTFLAERNFSSEDSEEDFAMTSSDKLVDLSKSYNVPIKLLIRYFNLMNKLKNVPHKRGSPVISAEQEDIENKLLSIVEDNKKKYPRINDVIGIINRTYFSSEDFIELDVPEDKVEEVNKLIELSCNKNYSAEGDEFMLMKIPADKVDEVKKLLGISEPPKVEEPKPEVKSEEKPVNLAAVPPENQTPPAPEVKPEPPKVEEPKLEVKPEDKKPEDEDKSKNFSYLDEYLDGTKDSGIKVEGDLNFSSEDKPKDLSYMDKYI